MAGSNEDIPNSGSLVNGSGSLGGMLKESDQLLEGGGLSSASSTIRSGTALLQKAGSVSNLVPGAQNLGSIAQSGSSLLNLPNTVTAIGPEAQALMKSVGSSVTSGLGGLSSTLGGASGGSPLANAQQPFQLITPLDEGALSLTGFWIVENMSQNSGMALHATSPVSAPVDFNAVVGKNITVKMVMAGDSPVPQYRYISGTCTDFVHQKSDQNFNYYGIIVEPKFNLLKHNIQSRIFQQKSVPDILKEILKKVDVEFRLQENYEPHEYCVQFRESDCDFADRLMEEEGIFYFYEYTETANKMIIADRSTSSQPVPGTPIGKYDAGNGGVNDPQRVNQWTKGQDIQPASYVSRDHHQQLPGNPLQANATLPEKIQVGNDTHYLHNPANEGTEHYNPTGGYAQRFDEVNAAGSPSSGRVGKVHGEKDRLIQVQAERHACQAVTIEGHSNCSNYTPGHTFTLQGSPSSDDQYLLTAVVHHAEISSNASGGSGRGITYNNTFFAIPVKVPYRPQLMTPRPKIHGVQHAVVSGPAGEEIHTDKYGRVKVQFPWDKTGPGGADSSCWIRVGSHSAGGGFGASHIPRIGHEVLVSFTDGDPDHPVITGSVPNPASMNRYGLPGNKTRSGIHTDSTPGGGGANALWFEDAKGAEGIFLKGEKDMDTLVGNKHVENIGNEHHQLVGADHVEKIKGSHHRAIEKNLTEKITGNITRQTMGGVEELIVGARLQVVKAGESFLSMEGGYVAQVKGDIVLHTTDSAITLQASKAIILQCGPNFIQISPDGITIQGTKVSINPGGAATPIPPAPFNMPEVTPRAPDQAGTRFA
jgi:type VI secretion system secreted protein VgrG